VDGCSENLGKGIPSLILAFRRSVQEEEFGMEQSGLLWDFGKVAISGSYPLTIICEVFL